MFINGFRWLSLADSLHHRLISAAPPALVVVHTTVTSITHPPTTATQRRRETAEEQGDAAGFGDGLRGASGEVAAEAFLESGGGWRQRRADVHHDAVRNVQRGESLIDADVRFRAGVEGRGAGAEGAGDVGATGVGVQRGIGLRSRRGRACPRRRPC